MTQGAENIRGAERFEALHALYDNKQQWVRHYETLLAQLTPLSTTASLALCAYLAENRSQIDMARLYLLLPLALTGFALWFTWWCDAEVKRQFRQIVTAETGMGFYDIEVEGEPVLPAMYKDSPVTTRPIVWAGYASQAISLLVIVIVAVLLR